MNFSSIFSFFTKNTKNIIDEVTSISSLAPKILTKKEDLEKVQPYLDKLKDTLNAKGINNIALTGGYGSGKSTLLKTFQHWNQNDYNFLNISLAAFNQTKDEEKFKDLYKKLKIGTDEEFDKENKEKEVIKKFRENFIKNEELEKQLEISILQQIIYKVKPSNLPESRFKRIVNIPNWKLWGLIPFGFILWISSIVLLFKYKYLDALNPNKWTFKIKDIDLTTALIFVLAFAGIGYFSKLAVELFSNSKINKVNLKGEIEIGDDSNKSVLNEHYDEILYYFEKNPFNVVVIEDLDRFENTNIFTKLRELNILLNNADTLKNKPGYKKFGIKFLYAVGDDFFDDKMERVKFFEYIIPVIPFINSSNASEQLKKMIKETELDDNIFSKEFLSDVTIFIEDIDMRLLTNIFHEFVIYRNTLKPEFIKKPEELFAIITYKNIDPEDFNKLNNKKGKLYKLINGKKKYVESLIKKIDDQITDLGIKINDIKNENVLNLEELRSIYVIMLSKKIPNASDIYINNSRHKFGDLVNEDLFKEVIITSDFRYYQNGNGVYSSNISFSNIEKEVNSNYNYIKRESLIKDKLNNKEQTLKNELDNLKTKKAEINSWELKQIFEEIDLNQFLDDFSNNGLLRNLILNGYINENYNDYISLFHGVNLDKADFQFKKNVVGKFQTDFDFKLSKIENLVDEIDERHFKTEFILNYDLLNFLEEKYLKFSAKYDIIIIQLTNEKERSIEFIDGYILLNRYITKESLIETFGKQVIDDDSLKKTNEEHEKKLILFIDKLTKCWSGFWEYIYLKSDYPEDKVNTYLGLIIRFSKIETIINNQNNKLLKEAIEQNPYFLSLIKKTNELNYIAKITKLFEQLNVKFEKLENPTKETKELFDFVYNNSNYEINRDNLLQMIKFYGKNEDLFETSNYSTIQNSNCKPITEYVNSAIDIYVRNVYLKLDQNKFEDEESLINLLNHKELDFMLKCDIIEKVETKISDLSTIKRTTVKGVLLDENKVVPLWSNAVDYYINCESKIDTDLVHFLNFENVYTELSIEKMIFESESFDYPSFRENLLLCNELSYESYSNILKNSIYTRDILLFENLNEDKVVYLTKYILNTTKSNYDLLREHFPNNHITLVERNFKKFIENISDFETGENDILSLLKSENITIDNRFKYISKLEEQTIIDNKDIAKKVGEIILFKETNVEFEFNTIEALILNTQYTEGKVKIINLYFSTLSNSNNVSLVRNINSDFEKLFLKGKPTFPKTNYNDSLFRNLESKQIIKKYYSDKWNDDKFRVTTIY